MSTTTQSQPAIAQARGAPAAILISGPAGSGKSTLAAALATALHYAVVDLDTVTGPLTRAALERAGADVDDLETPDARALREARYETLLAVATDNLAVGRGVVLAAPFTTERRDPPAWASLIERFRPADAVLLYLQAPATTLRERLSARDQARDRAKLRRGPEMPGAETLIPDALVLDASAPTEAQLDAALAALALTPDRPLPPRRPHQPSRC